MYYPWALTQQWNRHTKNTETLSFKACQIYFYIWLMSPNLMFTSLLQIAARLQYKQRTKILYTLQNLSNVKKITSL